MKVDSILINITKKPFKDPIVHTYQLVFVISLRIYWCHVDGLLHYQSYKKIYSNKKTRLQRLKVGETKSKKNNEERKQQTQSKKKVDFLYEVGFLGETGKKGPFFWPVAQWPE